MQQQDAKPDQPQVVAATHAPATVSADIRALDKQAARVRARIAEKRALKRTLHQKSQPA